jgi:hypothetical protein
MEARKTGSRLFRAQLYASVSVSEMLQDQPLDPVFGVWGDMQKIWVTDY